MEKNYIKENLESIFESFKKMISVETVVGTPIELGDTILVPFVNVTFGFGTGGSSNCKDVIDNSNLSSGGAGGARMEPTAILVIKGERIEMFSVNGDYKTSGFDRLIGMVPEIITKMKKEKYIFINENEENKQN